MVIYQRRDNLANIDKYFEQNPVAPRTSHHQVTLTDAVDSETVISDGSFADSFKTFSSSEASVQTLAQGGVDGFKPNIANELSTTAYRALKIKIELLEALIGSFTIQTEDGETRNINNPDIILHRMMRLSLSKEKEQEVISSQVLIRSPHMQVLIKALERSLPEAKKAAFNNDCEKIAGGQMKVIDLLTRHLSPENIEALVNNFKTELAKLKTIEKDSSPDFSGSTSWWNPLAKVASIFADIRYAAPLACGTTLGIAGFALNKYKPDARLNKAFSFFHSDTIKTAFDTAKANKLTTWAALRSRPVLGRIAGSIALAPLGLNIPISLATIGLATLYMTYKHDPAFQKKVNHFCHSVGVDFIYKNTIGDFSNGVQRGIC